MSNVVYAAKEGKRFAGSTTLVVVKCHSCHIAFAIPETLDNAALEHRGPQGWRITCPMGHQWWYVGETDLEAAQRQRDEARRQRNAERDLREHTERKLNAQKGATTKARKRHAAGVCPCCNRSFQQLTRHMASKHPEYDPAKDAKGNR